MLHGMKYFSVADTKKGYWHVEVDYESSVLCTFNSPFVRYRFKRLPFGVNVSQDVFQHKLDEVFKNIPNVGGIADDILIVGNTPQEHEQAFINMLEASRNNNVSLNSEKLEFKQPKIGFYGQAITDKGIAPAAEKLEAIQNIKTPTNSKELLSILGIVSTHIIFVGGIFSHVHFRWEPHHQTALDKIKEEICSARVILYFLLITVSEYREVGGIPNISDPAYNAPLQLYFQGHTGESSVPGMTSLLHCNCSCSWSVTLTVTILIHISLNRI